MIQVTETVTATLSVPSTPTQTEEPIYIPEVISPTLTVTYTLPYTYTVVSGDTLFEIAQEFDVSVYEIALKNDLDNINLIYAGQTLIIPAPSPDPEPTVVVGKQIVVVLSTQKVYAYEDGVLLNTFIVSTGMPDTPTVEGDFNIYIKLESTRMTGPGYDLPDVPWTMYFYQGYGLHGTYWHNNFGTPMSHGCVNLSIDDAKWLYDFAPLDTPVHVIP